jgi:hypothetical protein
MTTPFRTRRNAAWTPLVIRFVAEHLPGVGDRLDAYLSSRLQESVSQSRHLSTPVVRQVSLLRSLLDSHDERLGREFDFEPWKLFLSLAHHHRLEGNKDDEEEALRQVLLEIEKLGAVAVLDHLRLGRSRREQHKQFGERRGTQRHLESVSRVSTWQREADQIWGRNPSLSASDVAKQIERQSGSGKWGTIRRHIKQRVGSEPPF